MIYTSYYSGRQIGKSISISLRPPKECSFDSLPLFAPSEDLLKFWKASKKDDAAQQKYSEIFRQEMDAKKSLIDLWINKLNSSHLTLNCDEKPEDFCHRHILKDYLPSELWGGEVELINKISIADATWAQIFGNHYEIIFDDRPIEIKEFIPVVKANSRRREAS